MVVLNTMKMSSTKHTSTKVLIASVTSFLKLKAMSMGSMKTFQQAVIMMSPSQFSLNYDECLKRNNWSSYQSMKSSLRSLIELSRRYPMNLAHRYFIRAKNPGGSISSSDDE